MLAASMKLEGTEWAFAGDAGKSARFVSFSAGQRVSGFSGCNRFTGKFHQSDDKLTIGPLASTRMACKGGGMQREQSFLALLRQVHSVRIVQSKLTLLGKDGSQLTTLIRRGKL